MRKIKYIWTLLKGIYHKEITPPSFMPENWELILVKTIIFQTKDAGHQLQNHI